VKAMLGRVIKHRLGLPLDGKGEIATSETRLIESMGPPDHSAQVGA